MNTTAYQTITPTSVPYVNRGQIDPTVKLDPIKLEEPPVAPFVPNDGPITPYVPKTEPGTEPGEEPIINPDSGEEAKSAAPWLLVAGAAVAAFLLLKK